MPPTIRLLRSDDATPLAEILSANKAFLEPWEPVRDPSYFEVSGQRDVIERDLGEHAAGRMAPFVIEAPDGVVAGRLGLNGITRGAFQSATLGYWVRQDLNGNGLATRAVAEAVTFAFTTLRLHRVQAETLLHNTRSQRVLDTNGFHRFGVAEQYLRIAGTWQDHALFQVLSDQPCATRAYSTRAATPGGSA